MIRKIIVPICLLSCFTFVGCVDSNNTKLEKNINKYISSIENNINNSYMPTYNDLTISAFTDSDKNLAVSADINQKEWHVILSAQDAYTPRYVNTQQLGGFNNYVSKIENIYVQMHDSVSAVGEFCEMKEQINNVIIKLKDNVKQIKNENILISDMQLETTNELLKESYNISQNLSNNSLKEDVKKLKEQKNNILNTSSISTKYIKIINAIDTNITKIRNIHQSLLQINSLIKFSNQGSNIIQENHYISSDILNAPISRDEYIKEFEKNNSEHFNNELKFTLPTKKELPYRKDENTPTPLSNQDRIQNLPFAKDNIESKNNAAYL